MSVTSEETGLRARRLRLPSLRGAIGWVLPLLLVLLWEAMSRSGAISENVLPAPSAVLAASIFHFGTYTIRQAKEHMAAAGIPVRLA
jgi:ABC-type nitrate/sulfonate/bicarbonate transport system permease component